MRPRGAHLPSFRFFDPFRLHLAAVPGIEIKSCSARGTYCDRSNTNREISIMIKLLQLFRFIAILAVAVATFLLTSCSDVDVYTVHTQLTADGSVIQTPQLTTVHELQKRAKSGGPLVRVENPTHDFGRMDPLTQRRHLFVICNVGDAPLKLEQGPTTCKCTLSGLSNRHVLPGKAAHVVVQWNSGRDLHYAHTAKIYTNDPRNRVIDLRIKGTVEALFRCEPKEIVFSRVAPGETQTASTVVFSQVWDDIDIADVNTSLDGLAWSIEAVDSAEKAALDARSAYRLSITLPDDLPQGYFSSPVRISGRPKGEVDVDAETFELGVQGKVLRRLSVYGRDVTGDGTVVFGRIPEGQGASVRLLMKLRDEDKRLVARSIECQPKSLKVNIEPYRTDSDRELGLYYLVVEVPKNAPTFRLPPKENGYIRIEFDHPRADLLELPVDLIVTPKGDLASMGT